MVEIDGKIVSDDVFEKEFVCDLSQCKGACCVQGDAGAPLTEKEMLALDEIYESVKPFMRKEGIDAVSRQGIFTLDFEGEYGTTLVDNKECAFAIYNEKGIVQCSIEKAYEAGKTDFPKPISCHLYPIRVTKLSVGEAVNYDKWEICEPACKCGAEMEVNVFRFLKKPLIRMYGEEWFEKLEMASKLREA